MKSAKLSSKDLILSCAKAAIDKKADQSLIFEIGKLGAFTDYFLVTSGTNERQVQAIADEICRMSKATGLGNPKVEGYDEGRWILIDLGSAIVHVFHDAIRGFYDLEALWTDAPRIKIPEEFYTGSVHKRSQLLSAH